MERRVRLAVNGQAVDRVVNGRRSLCASCARISDSPAPTGRWCGSSRTGRYGWRWAIRREGKGTRRWWRRSSQHPSPFTPLGAKGVGEGGAIPAPAAVANAVDAALAHLGVVIRALPITPDAVWRWLDAARETGSR